jgi:hypothetical protein
MSDFLSKGINANEPEQVEQAELTEALETSLSTSVITREHDHIGSRLLDRVSRIISGKVEIEQYGVSVGQGAWDSDSETIKIKVNEKTFLNISISVKRS